MSEIEPSKKSSERLSPSDLPGLARVVAVSGFRVGAWAASTGVNVTKRVVDVAIHPGHAVDLAEDVRAAATAVTRALVGNEAGDPRQHPGGKFVHNLAANPMVRVMSDTIDSVTPHHQPAVQDHPAPDPVQAAGRDLIRRSRDVWANDLGHPAYARIVKDLTPDECRILLLLMRKGPQATVDVRTGGLIGTVSSTLVRAHLNMVGAMAGLRYLDRVPSYLHNLERLGLIAFSGEHVKDPMDYQVLEVQPDVLEAMGEVRRAKCVRNSITLTPFGQDFCRDGLGFLEADAVSEPLA